MHLSWVLSNGKSETWWDAAETLVALFKIICPPPPTTPRPFESTQHVKLF